VDDEDGPTARGRSVDGLNCTFRRSSSVDGAQAAHAGSQRNLQNHRQNVVNGGAVIMSSQVHAFAPPCRASLHASSGRWKQRRSGSRAHTKPVTHDGDCCSRCALRHVTPGSSGAGLSGVG